MINIIVPFLSLFVSSNVTFQKLKHICKQKYVKADIKIWAA